MITADHLREAGVALANNTGLRASGAASNRLESRLRDRIAALGVDPDDYVAGLHDDPAETQNLVDHLTVKETSFFRDESHFDALIRHVVPRHQSPLVVWSAGCATGQEPYSLAMALDEAGVDDFRIIATDISRPAVEHVRAAHYRESELRGLSAARRGRYLVREGDGWQIDPALQERVSVHHHNLLTDPLPPATSHAAAVFCRNVFIYLERPRIDRFLVDVRTHLVPGGVVFVGGSESLWSVPDGYCLTRLGEAFCYSRVEQETVNASAPPRVAAVTKPRPAPPKQRCVEVEPGIDVETTRSDVDRHRAAVYAAPDDVLAYLRLGLSLEAAGDHGSCLRAFRAARSALDRTDDVDVERDLEGYSVAALRTMLDHKLEGDPACRS